MNTMSIFVAIITTWGLLSILHTFEEDLPTRFLYLLADGILSLPVALVYGVFAVISFPFVFIWKFFRNAFKGVSVDCWERAKLKHYRKFGNFYFCYDKKARALENKVFLVRVVKPANEIIHYPKIGA